MTLTGGTVTPMTSLRAALADFDRETVAWGLYRAAGRLTAAAGDFYASVSGQNRAEIKRKATEGRTHAEATRILVDALPMKGEVDVPSLRKAMLKYASDCDAYAADLEAWLVR